MPSLCIKSLKLSEKPSTTEPPMKPPRTSIKKMMKRAKKTIKAINAKIRKVEAGIDQSDAKIRTIEAEIGQQNVNMLELLHKIRESRIELMNLDPAWNLEGLLAAAAPPWRSLLLAPARTPYRRGSIVLDLPNTLLT
jgi:hypothetical protein